MMVLLLEDVVDCLTILHPEFDYLFLFDYSCGHDRQHEDGLNSGRMLKLFGGMQPKMRAAEIKKREGYLGFFQASVAVSDVQQMVFSPTDAGPLWMLPEEHEAKWKETILSATKVQNFKKKEPLEKLKERNITYKGNMEGLKRVAVNNGIPVSEEIQIQKVEEGWEGKPKGVFQVLWDRGFINSEDITKSLKDYKIKGRKDQYGIINVQFSLTHQMCSCTDF
jgi:hypothetical protein